MKRFTAWDAPAAFVNRRWRGIWGEDAVDRVAKALLQRRSTLEAYRSFKRLLIIDWVCHIYIYISYIYIYHIYIYHIYIYIIYIYIYIYHIYCIYIYIYIEIYHLYIIYMYHLYIIYEYGFNTVYHIIQNHILVFSDISPVGESEETWDEFPIHLVNPPQQTWFCDMAFSYPSSNKIW